ncbi:hypothetical protein [Microbispora bryophytorum]|uniref:Uncharacterized protein n=1 Tax=Microbispora bryophytorum TaxID=1460882 RepID=A0A8H9GTP3_9ACTN|nr:hypothetical protein [Microbispora bryophytorum]MBD3135743.1 hypothetical protein [Microbispora bryophytorum]TQS09905.1 hypothetical protein FLX07_02275 [Microbispora bryophytorum]GGN99236.1 hypothetical protein GCM10011574_04680 [Microbispora bryophytorum]
MRLEMLYKDQGSGGNGCPAIYLAENGQIVVQGPAVDRDTFSNLVNVLPGEIALQIAPEVLLGAVDRLHAKNEAR